SRHLDDHEVDRLRDLVDGGAGVVVIAAVDRPPAWGHTVTVAADGTVAAVGNTTAGAGEPTRFAVIDDDQAAALAELFDTAAASTTAATVSSTRATAPTSPTVLVDLLAEVDVVVRVLGEVGAVRRTG